MSGVVGLLRARSLVDSSAAKRPPHGGGQGLVLPAYVPKRPKRSIYSAKGLDTTHHDAEPAVGIALSLAVSSFLYFGAYKCLIYLWH